MTEKRSGCADKAAETGVGKKTVRRGHVYKVHEKEVVGSGVQGRAKRPVAGRAPTAHQDFTVFGQKR